MSEFFGVIRRHRLSIFVLVVLVLVGWMLWTARGALPAFFIGLALAFVLDPVVTRLGRWGVPRWGGVLISYALLVGIVWIFVAFAVPPIAAQSREFIDHLPELGASIQQLGRDVAAWYATLPLPAELRMIMDNSISSGERAFGDLLSALVTPVVGSLVRVATFVFGLVIVPVWLFYVLKDRERFPLRVAGALPPAWRADGVNVLALLGGVGGRWVRGQLLLGVSIFVATAIALTILTFIGFREFGQFTLVLALIAGVLEWFPIIGPILAAVPALLVAITISPAAAIAVVIVYIGIQQLENNILVPKVMGDAVDLHPAVLILALVVGGALFGIGGAILAAPTVAAGRDLYRYGFLRLSGMVPRQAYAVALHGAKAMRRPRAVSTPTQESS
ncbi:MAG: AI-2E family transporter [Chloroflexota bacterium]